MVKQVMVAYQTNDGNLFKSKVEAEQWERDLLFAKQTVSLRKAVEERIKKHVNNDTSKHILTVINILFDKHWLFHAMIDLGWQINPADENQAPLVEPARVFSGSDDDNNAKHF